jgi:hypothetical protein
MSHQRTCYKGYDGANILRWYLKIKPFVAQWIIQMKEDMHKLGAIGDHMSPWAVVGKGRCYCQFVLRLQEGNTLINHKPNNYDWSYKGPIP